MAIGGLCGAKIGLKKVMIKGGNYLCYDCVKAAGFYPLTWTGNMKTSLSEIQIRINGSNDTTNTTEMTVTQYLHGKIYVLKQRMLLVQGMHLNQSSQKRSLKQIPRKSVCSMWNIISSIV